MKIIDAIKCIFSSVIAKIFFRNKSYWVVSERGTDARDNGYWFYKYLRENHPEINSIFVINDDSPDYQKVASLGKTVSPNGIMHGIIYYSASYIIGTHPGCGKPRWNAMYALEKYKLAVPRGHRVFLQHGITKDMIPSLTAKQLQTDLFICGVKPEYDYVRNNFGFKEGVVQYTGFARFDNLTPNINTGRENKERTILLMPTWRHSLSGKTQAEFLKSDYFKRYFQILNSEKLDSILNAYNCQLIFYPHYEIQNWINNFFSSSANIVIADFNNYDVQDLLKRADILITDYSSVFFDMAYMSKETIFYQFDYSFYRLTHYSEGYFDYHNSFGPVVDSLDMLLQGIEKFLKYGVEQRYLDNMNSYFTYYDKSNCERIFSAIRAINCRR